MDWTVCYLSNYLIKAAYQISCLMLNDRNRTTKFTEYDKRWVSEKIKEIYLFITRPLEDEVAFDRKERTNTQCRSLHVR